MVEQGLEVHSPADPHSHRPQLLPPPPPPQQQQEISLMSGRIMLMAISAFFTTIFIVFVFHICIRYHLVRRERRRRAALLLAFTDRSPNLNPSANRGIDPDLLQSLPITVRSASNTPIDCSVCLSKIEEGEKMRILPKCRHEFHAECIDMWFSSHSTCPLCRSTIDTDTPAVFNAGTSSSSEEAMVRIEEPPVRIEELGLGFGSRLWWELAGKGLLIRDQGLNRGTIADADLERGEAAELDPNPVSGQSTAQGH
ncbi:Zinc finger RING/FYVE/PHD-type protein [Dioscorea alata]|uniref:Zinc finger RING/FYVE/PHD-type protein n=1 Tax=Dioscorea alata TaxID=55571 RepID=A0ACB7VV33_DIOAL|nr:Zinc finger RING/FYVE/PHD-type protein [Dioscorea alata]